MNSRIQTRWQDAMSRLAPRARLAAQRYQALAPREKRLVCAMAFLIACAFSYGVLLEPAAKTVSALQAQLPELRTQAATVAALSSQAIAQRRNSKRTQPVLPERSDLAASLAAAGLATPQWSTDVSAQTASGALKPAPLIITLQAAPASAVLSWIDAIAFDWGLSVKELDLTRATNAGGRPLPGLVNGKIVLNIVSGDSATANVPASNATVIKR